MPIVADGADGAMGSVLTHGRYPDCPRSQPPLAEEDNLTQSRVCGGTYVPGAAGQRVRGNSLSSLTGWYQPAEGPMRYPSIVLCRL
jgi:hypothetical protein